ncbi:MAG TPA: FG-GAP-like repeat-containing protein [Acidobacteriota bacterium]|nr:FG-GAP-like repeat-containing protein [Acidobacteriota bacterium]
MFQKGLAVVTATVLFCLLTSPTSAVTPPVKGVQFPQHVIEAQKVISETYGVSSIATRLREIKREKELAAETDAVYRPATVTFNIPVVMGSYSNNAHIFTAGQFWEQLFGFNPTGSMADYFDEVSYGEFNVTGTVYGPFTAAQTQAYYVQDDNGFGVDFPTNASGFIYSILGVGDPTIDFSQYDNDGPDGIPNSGDDDGFVDALIVIFPDGDAAAGDNDNLWAHKWNLQYGAGAPYTTNDARYGGGNIEIDLYTIQGGEKGAGTLNQIRPIGTFCHEFGHVLGLPDLYDSDNSSYGVGTYCLMGSGNWGVDWSVDTEHHPTHPSAWCKVDMGWVIPKTVIHTWVRDIPPVETDPMVYRLWEDAYQGTRYFLLENRTQTGFDVDFAGEGVLIWHVNEDVCYDNSVDNFRLVDLEEADGLDQIDHKTSYMDAGDFYPGSTNNTEFSDVTYPSAKDVFGEFTAAVATNFAYGAGSDVSVTLTQRSLYGYTLAYHHHSNMRSWGSASPQVMYGAVRFTSFTDGLVTSVQLGAHEGTPVGYSVRIFDDIVSGSPSGLNSTTTGTFPNYPNDRYHEITLSSPLTVTTGQTFLVDGAWGPDDYAIPYTYREPVSGQSFFSGDGSSYSNWTDKDVLVRARVQFASGMAPEILTVTPAQNELNVVPYTNIWVRFNADMDESTFTNSTFVVHGDQTGLHPGTFGYNSLTHTVTFNPSVDFADGEEVSVVLTTGIESAVGMPLDSSYAWSFRVAVVDGFATFVTDSAYSLGPHMAVVPQHVAAADLDGDGDMDLATCNATDTVSVLLNDGTGTFGPHANYYAGQDPTGITVADLDADGDLDIAVPRQRDSVSVLLNNSDGTFAPVASYPTAAWGVCIAHGDIDGDGDIDLVTGDHSTDEVRVSLNNGDGTFAFGYPVQVGLRPDGVTVADLDNDGNLDIATANTDDNDVTVQWNWGGGLFSYPMDYPVDDRPVAVTTGDFNADGLADLAVACLWSWTVSVLINQGDSMFAVHVDYPVSEMPWSVTAADVDGDGDLDLTASCPNTEDISVLLNNGDGTFAPYVAYPVQSEGPMCVDPADLDGDGDMDLAVACQMSSDIVVMFNQYAAVPHVVSATPAQNALNIGLDSSITIRFDMDMDWLDMSDANITLNGSCSGPHEWSRSFYQPDLTVTLDPVIDFDHGEQVTVVVTRKVHSSLGIPLADAYAWTFTAVVDSSDGMFDLDSTYAITGYEIGCVYAADFNGDTYPDLAVTHRSYRYAVVALNNGDGTYGPPVAYDVGKNPYSVIAADFDGDGDIDVATAEDGGTGVSVLKNNGDGTFGSLQIYPVGAWKLCAADLDGDGDHDIAAAGPWDSLSVLFNDGTGAFAYTRTFPISPAGTYPWAVCSADLDNDGDFDLAASTTNGWFVALLNAGDGTFSQHDANWMGDDPDHIIAADLDGDGDQDLATAHMTTDGAVVVRANNGDGTFGALYTYPVGPNVFSLVAGDLNGDGHLDLAATPFGAAAASVLLNNGDGTFAEPSAYTCGDDAWFLCAADVDNDGAVDLVTVSDSKFAVLINRCCMGLTGNVDGSEAEDPDIGDLTALIDYLFISQQEPDCPEEGNIDGDANGTVDIGDLTALIRYLFIDATAIPAPCQ